MGNLKVFSHLIQAENANVVILPLNWSLKKDSTVNDNINNIIEASNKIETFHEFYGFQKNCKIGCDDDNQSLNQWLKTIKALIYSENPVNRNDDLIFTDYKNACSYVEEKIEFWLEKNKLPITISGDSTLLIASLKAHSKFKNAFSLLHLAETPNLKEYKTDGILDNDNAIFIAGNEIPEIKKIIGIGHQKISYEEYHLKQLHPEKIIWFPHRKTQQNLFAGTTFETLCKKWTNTLSEFVFLNIDLSILKSLTLTQIEYFLQHIVASKRKFIGIEITGIDELNQVPLNHSEIAGLILIIAKTFGRSRGKI